MQVCCILRSKAEARDNSDLLYTPFASFAAVICYVFDVNLCFGRPNALSQVIVAHTVDLHSQVYAAFETLS